MNYTQYPRTSLQNNIRSGNVARSAGVINYKGVSNSPLDNDLSDLRSQRPKVIHLAEHMADHEIAMSGDKRKFFSPKQYQTIISNFDLSNLNSNYDTVTGSYEFTATDSRYYGNTFGKSGLEKVYQFDSGILNMPRTFNFEQSRLFIQIETTDFNVANFDFNYMFISYPDSALSTINRISFKPIDPSFQLNGYCALNNIKLIIRDAAGPLILPDPKINFTISAVGLTTQLTLPNHGLQVGMRVYLNAKNGWKVYLPGVYTVISVTQNTLELNADTSGYTNLIGLDTEFIVDDYVFNYNIRVLSIREDEKSLIPNMR